MQIRPLALLLAGALSLGTLSAQKMTTKKEAVAVQAPMGEAKEAPAFQLMALPYATDALAPVISKRTVETHITAALAELRRLVTLFVVEMLLQQFG